MGISVIQRGVTWKNWSRPLAFSLKTVCRACLHRSAFIDAFRSESDNAKHSTVAAELATYPSGSYKTLPNKCTWALVYSHCCLPITTANDKSQWQIRWCTLHGCISPWIACIVWRCPNSCIETISGWMTGWRSCNKRRGHSLPTGERKGLQALLQ